MDESVADLYVTLVLKDDILVSATDVEHCDLMTALPSCMCCLMFRDWRALSCLLLMSMYSLRVCSLIIKNYPPWFPMNQPFIIKNRLL